MVKRNNTLSSDDITGYIEGYYGNLLDWSQRQQLLHQTQVCGLSHYFYAPKEDTQHRLHWRKPYGDAWRDAFRGFCVQAKRLGVVTVAGVAPGLDFDFAHLDSTGHSGSGSAPTDVSRLVSKARQLRHDGAQVIALLMDDIDEDFHTRSGPFQREGQAHAVLANCLAASLDCELWVVPRVYADEIAAQSPQYLSDFCTELEQQHRLVYCGENIVSETVSTEAIRRALGCRHELVIWDNLYANDYCPRRLFVGAFSGREEASSIMLNPTGMVATDCLLLDIMRRSMQANDIDVAWQQALADGGVPEAFFDIAPYVSWPAFGGQAQACTLVDNKAALAALEVLLWKWKTPLSREWYPYLMGLKQDINLALNQLPLDRIHKTQMPPLAARLTRQGGDSEDPIN